jgi:hypothetical protein
MAITAQILRPLLDRQKTAWRVLNFFAETPKRELSFYQRFAELPGEDRVFLAEFYETQTPWALFQRICLLWGVPLRPANRRAMTLG